MAALSLSLVWSGSALADPQTPSTADEAQQAWLDSSHRAEALNEELLVAQGNEQAAVTTATAAADQVNATTAAAAAAQQRAAEADQAAASYKGKVDAFANASFRGANLSQISVLLTADSADDYLDQVSSLDRVAGDTRQTLEAALAARAAAAQAQSDAASAQATAEKAKADADAAQVSAHQATADVTARKSDLDAASARYKALYDSLSEQERQAAEAAEQRAAEAANAAAAAANPVEAAPAHTPPVTQLAANRSENRVPLSQESAPAAAPSRQEESAPSAPAGSSAASVAVAAALSKVGSPYVYGAAGPNAFDCSGLTSWAWAQAGVTIPRTSGGQSGLPTVPLSQLQPGDLVTYYSPVSHIAMYIGNGQVVHASTETKPVYVTSVNSAGPNPVGHRVTG